jgi:hypothetical protein
MSFRIAQSVPGSQRITLRHLFRRLSEILPLNPLAISHTADALCRFRRPPRAESHQVSNRRLQISDLRFDRTRNGRPESETGDPVTSILISDLPQCPKSVLSPSACWSVSTWADGRRRSWLRGSRAVTWSLVMPEIPIDRYCKKGRAHAAAAYLTTRLSHQWTSFLRAS